MSTPGDAYVSSSFRIIATTRSVTGYAPKYTSIAYVKRILGNREYSDITNPTLEDVMNYIEEAEVEIDNNEWGTYRAIDEYMMGRDAVMSFNWFYSGYNAQVFKPAHNNIIKVIKCEYNSSGSLASDPTWSEVKEGPAQGSSFIQLRKSDSFHQQGKALLFYSNTPIPGPMRIRFTYDFGHNMPNGMLREYAGKLAAINVILQKAAAELINVNTDDGPWAALFRQHNARLKAMRKEILPKTKVGAYIYPSIG